MYVKVCGITRIEDAQAAVAAGAHALGFNCVPGSKRQLEATQIRAIVAQVRSESPTTLQVAVVADLTTERALALLDELGVDRLQLHGDESARDVEALGARAFKALRVADAADIKLAATFPGEPLLVDAKVAGQLGGTGHTLDWPLVEPLARARVLILAGGLTPENVAHAVRLVRPWGVDVASGVEVAGEPRRKDSDKLRRFVDAARAASADTAGSL
jgi:phosphoribosylanthranilate isomerase